MTQTSWPPSEHLGQRTPGSYCPDMLVEGQAHMTNCYCAAATRDGDVGWAAEYGVKVQ